MTEPTFSDHYYDGRIPGEKPERTDAVVAKVYALGYEEGLGDVGMTYDDDPESLLSRAYDAGRTVRRVLEDWEDPPERPACPNCGRPLYSLDFCAGCNFELVNGQVPGDDPDSHYLTTPCPHCDALTVIELDIPVTRSGEVYECECETCGHYVAVEDHDAPTPNWRVEGQDGGRDEWITVDVYAVSEDDARDVAHDYMSDIASIEPIEGAGLLTTCDPVPRIVVFLEGGLIQNVTTLGGEAQVITIDYDAGEFGDDDDRVTMIPQDPYHNSNGEIATFPDEPAWVGKWTKLERIDPTSSIGAFLVGLFERGDGDA